MSDVARRTWTAQDLCGLVDGRLVGQALIEVTGLGRMESAAPGEITFLASDKYIKFLATTRASCVIISEVLAVEIPPSVTVIVVPDAYRAFVRVMQEFFPPLRLDAGLRHSTATIHASATIDATASIGPGCVVGENCTVSAGTQLMANVVLYPDCHVGSNTIIHSNVTLYAGSRIGDACIIHAGAVLGADGFGFLEQPDGSFDKIPQVGTVRIGNGVEVGANCTIDRAAVGETVLEDGVKLDNLVHIAHGVVVGRHSAIAAQAGVSGSTRLGERNRIAGQVGIVGHITTVDNVVVEAQSGVSKAITTPGAYFGSPAKEHRTALRLEAALRHLPQLMVELRELQRRIDELTSDNAAPTS
jgi:UDP-3-O-[3-hydroxymyristoyl] glucosamine N-acyltransferase